MTAATICRELARDFGPCVMRGKDGRMKFVGAPEIILEDREDVEKVPDARGNRPLTRGARRDTRVSEMWRRGAITKRMYAAAVRFLDDMSFATGSSGGSLLGVCVRVTPGSGTLIAERQIDALARVRWISSRLQLHDNAAFWWVVIRDRSTAEFDRRFHKREGTGVEWLRESLELLDELYNP
jgi:hypothetical protein